MRPLHFSLALILALSLPLQSLAAARAHDCEPKAAAAADHAMMSHAAMGHDLPASAADSAPDCCDEEGRCPVPNACSAPASAAMPVTHFTHVCPACRDSYPPGPANAPQTGHLVPLNRPPIAA